MKMWINIEKQYANIDTFKRHYDLCMEWIRIRKVGIFFPVLLIFLFQIFIMQRTALMCVGLGAAFGITDSYKEDGGSSAKIGRFLQTSPKLNRCKNFFRSADYGCSMSTISYVGFMMITDFKWWVMCRHEITMKKDILLVPEK